jgi:hypothetical protein
MPPVRYIFNHFAKTGGMSLLAICRHNLADSQISPHLREHQVRMSPTGRFDSHRLIAGHFGLASQAKLSAGRFSMTLLREPISRIFSLYTYWRRISEKGVETSKAKELSFPGFVRYFEQSPAIILNPYTHHFAGIGLEFADDNIDGPSLLASAKHNLSAFDFVGICEDYERSARLLCDELGWQLPMPLPHENRSGSAYEVANIDEQTMQILCERNQLDLELYAYGVSVLQERAQTKLGSAECQSASGDSRSACQSALNEPTRLRLKPTGFLPFPVPSAQDRKACIEAVSASWLPDERSQVAEIAVRFQTKVNIPDLILGVAILDATGDIVWGTNTFLEELELQNEPHCDCYAAFVVQCDAPVGTYTVTVALHQPRKYGFHDHWLDRATSFEVAVQAGNLDGGGFKLRQIRSTVDRDSQGKSADV